MALRIGTRWHGLLLGALFLAGCGVSSDPPPTNLRDRLTFHDPAVRAAAAADVPDAKDSTLWPILVDRLSDDAPEVRMIAAEALRRATGQEFGYRHYESAAQREKAIQAWRGWLARRAVENCAVETDGNDTHE
jgi:hypothetical protein